MVRPLFSLNLHDIVANQNQLAYRLMPASDKNQRFNFFIVGGLCYITPVKWWMAELCLKPWFNGW